MPSSSETPDGLESCSIKAAFSASAADRWRRSSDAFSASAKAIFRIKSFAAGSRSAGFVVMGGSPQQSSNSNILKSLRRGFDLSQYRLALEVQNGLILRRSQDAQ